jgi:hypothetical protein
MAVQVFGPAAAAVGEVLAWCRWQVSNGMQFGTGWCRKKWQVMQSWRLRLVRSTS